MDGADSIGGNSDFIKCFLWLRVLQMMTLRSPARGLFSF